jgi:prepilin-type N-terminal cleavage/methylation domain-containing protein
MNLRFNKQIALKGNSEQGLTLLETLVGILIISIVLAAATPPIMIAAASRIQNRRAEQAIQIAQQELDRVRLTMERDDSRNEQLPPAVSGKDLNTLKTVDAPTTICTTCTADTYASVTEVKQVGDFLVQVFREPGIKETDVEGPNDPTPADTQDRVMAFRMGVRVYSPAARQNLGSLQKEAASLQMTNSLGQQGKQPLAVLYADFSRPDLTLSLRAYRSFINR